MTHPFVFPAALQQAASALLDTLSVAELAPALPGITVSLLGERLSVPGRVYCAPDSLRTAIARSSGDTRLLALCLGTRHADGRVREACLRQILSVDRPWVAPFIVQLLGEYVIEIVEAIAASIDQEGPARFAGFAQENPAFMAITRQRATSYWDCYHRARYPVRQGYPALTALDAIEGCRNPEPFRPCARKSC